MPRYHEVYAFQGQSWTLVQALEAERTEIDRLAEEVFAHHSVQGLRVLGEERTRTGETRMRVLFRRDKRDGLPSFAIGPDGKPVYGGRPLNPQVRPVWEGTVLAAGTNAHTRRRRRIATTLEWIVGVTLLGASTGALLALHTVEPKDRFMSLLADAGRLACLLAIVGVLVRFVIQVSRSGVLLVEVKPEPTTRPPVIERPVPAPPAPPADPKSAKEEVVVARAFSLVDEGFRRVNHRLDTAGWIGFRLFLAGVARGMAGGGGKERQQRYLGRLLDRIGDAPTKIQDFVARWDVIFRVQRNIEMADRGTRAWEEMDPAAFERAMDWWSSTTPGGPVMSAVVCYVPMQTPGGQRKQLLDQFSSLVSNHGGEVTGDSVVASAWFPGAVAALDVAIAMLRDNRGLGVQVGVAAAVDADSAMLDARLLAGRARRDEILVSSAARELAGARMTFERAGADGAAALVLS